jgi:hypothetical protein
MHQKNGEFSIFDDIIQDFSILLASIIENIEIIDALNLVISLEKAPKLKKWSKLMLVVLIFSINRHQKCGFCYY